VKFGHLCVLGKKINFNYDQQLSGLGKEMISGNIVQLVYGTPKVNALLLKIHNRLYV
jgi:fido (protein-threonine AMPylation protein)